MVCGFKVCGPNEVMVISGCCTNGFRLVPGGRAFVLPCFQKIQRLSLNTLTLPIESQRVYTKLGVSITVRGVAQVKINGSKREMLVSACEQFLGNSEQEIGVIAQETLEGHQRAIMGNMTVEEIYKDRKIFSKAVFDVASSDLVNMGIQVVSYTLTDISDEHGYLHALGEARTAQVKAEARIGEAVAKRDAKIRTAEAERLQVAAQMGNQIEVALAERSYKLEQAAYDKEVAARKAAAEKAYELQKAKTNQQIKEQEMQIKVVERTQEIQVEELENERQQRRLEATVRKPADAERFRVEQLAEANRLQRIAEAEAEAERIRLIGEAEAEAMLAVSKAEAAQMSLQAEAWKAYTGPAKLNMIMEALPKVAAEVAAPLAQCPRVTMVSTGDGEVGVSKLTGELLTVMGRLPEMIQSMTGVNVNRVMQSTVI